MSILALVWDDPEEIRALLDEKFGEEDEEIQTAAGEGYDFRFQGSQGNQSDYVKHTNRMYNQFGTSQEEKQLNERYYDGPMCVHASNGQIPGTDIIFYSTTQFFDTAAAAQSHMQSIPTPAQDEVHAANGLNFQQDPDASDTDIIRNYIHWQPPGGTSVLRGYGAWSRNDQVITTLNIYQAQNGEPLVNGIDPNNPEYQRLKSAVQDILEQKANATPEVDGWPEYDIPEVIL